MRRLHLWLALVLLIAVNAVVAAGVVRNRAGSPDAELTLTERELVLEVSSAREENTGLALRLDWRREFVKDWFDADKLAALGFDARPGKSDDSPMYRRRELPVEAFVVLEYEGAAWLRYKRQQEQGLAELRLKLDRGGIEEEQAKRQRNQIEADLQAGSRLFAVAVGADPHRLRSRYPDSSRSIIAPALVRMNYRWEDKKRFLYGTIDSILVERLHVPSDLAAPLLALPSEGRLYRGRGYYGPGDKPSPRYEVQVRWGRRYEPWIDGVRLLDRE